jgi:hypothetical protein
VLLDLLLTRRETRDEALLIVALEFAHSPSRVSTRKGKKTTLSQGRDNCIPGR